jgi:hypothetical protein
MGGSCRIDPAGKQETGVQAETGARQAGSSVISYRPRVSKRSRFSSGLRRTRLTVVAWVGLFGPLLALAAVVDVLWVRLAIAGSALVSSVAVLWLTLWELQLEKRERLRVPPAPVEDVDPYEIGVLPEQFRVDPEAFRPRLRVRPEGERENRSYLPRELDARLREALDQALEPGPNR